MHRPPRSSAVGAILLVGLVTLAAGTARLWNLGHPDEKVFDEVYYASDGCLHAGLDHRECGLDADAERSWVHPPLGKHLISWGVHSLGNRPVGWRVASALAGTATVAMAGALAFLLLGSATWAGVAALLLAAEHLHFVQSRIAMLDILQTFFVVLGFLLLVWDRVRRERSDAWAPRPSPPALPVRGASREAPARRGIEEPTATQPPRVSPPGRGGPRWLRVAAGGALGAGAAVKWSGVLALAAGAVLAVAWERTRRARAEVPRPLTATVVEEGPSLALAFVAAPLLLYSMSWLPWLADQGFSLSGWWDNHAAMARYHLDLQPLRDGEPIHPYMSEGWTWLLLLRPVAYYYRGGDGTAAEILGIGNPVVFWGALLVIPYLAVVWWRRRDWRAGAVLVPIALQYVPWLFVTRPLFLFYMTPVAPFLALGLTSVLRDLAQGSIRGRRLAWASVAIVGSAVALFVFFWPVLVGDTIGRAAWGARMWLEGWV